MIHERKDLCCRVENELNQINQMKQEVSQINFEFLNIKNRAETLRLLSEKQKDLKEYLEGVQLGLEMESINKKRLDVLNNILDESIK